MQAIHYSRYKELYISSSLVLLSVVVSMLSNFGSVRAINQLLFISNYPIQFGFPELKSGQLWRLITPVFLHFSLIHLVFNALWVWLLCGNIESHKPRGLVLLLVLSIAIGANLAHFYFASSGPYFGGLSGLVYGLFGYIALQSYYRPTAGLIISKHITYFMIAWFIICWSGLLKYLFNINIANINHTAGLVLGIVIGFVEIQLAMRRANSPK